MLMRNRAGCPRVELTIFLVASLGLLSACGSVEAGTEPAASPTELTDSGSQTVATVPGLPPGSGPDIDWDSLNSPTIGVPSVEAALPLLPFTPIVPAAELGAPSKIIVSDPSVFSKENRGLGLRFDHPSYGRFWVTQDPLPSGISQEQLQADLESLADCEDRGCEGEWSLETIRGGIRGLLLIAPPHGATAVEWYENGIEMSVMGPPDAFTGEEALAAANRL